MNQLPASGAFCFGDNRSGSTIQWLDDLRRFAPKPAGLHVTRPHAQDCRRFFGSCERHIAMSVSVARSKRSASVFSTADTTPRIFMTSVSASIDRSPRSAASSIRMH